ncbi:putative FKBP-type peptidyl-prolyl cis-trans isomerase [Paratrimastix pyriformis]|uniref:peptidylprolyl isomerase n=1 Tax=Paratrimastix pyriformis TaxID=342808 RepID=A0ABQ8UJ32_9EUKA|nr:putative FKBP-type peptidyl-prolyl cis-trans isomerase [Paratrimastix pyriformis]
MLQKRVITPGYGEPPRYGQTCVVHYTGLLLNGREFDSSRRRGQPFAFSLGKGEVIKGWDQIIGTMRRGERISVDIPPELAYGAHGIPTLIPPNSTLRFDIELISFY